MPTRRNQRGGKLLGCWTCRLRRKKCDQRRPVCASCAALEITCHVSADKPEWMDGSSRQKEMVLKVKNEVKQNSNIRRQRRGDRVRGFILTSKEDYSREQLSQPLRDASVGLDASTGTPETVPQHAAVRDAPQVGLVAPVLISKRSRHIQSTFEDASSIPIRRRYPDPSTMEAVARASQGLALTPLTGLAQEFDLELVMMYLDYDFPFLFPFYRAPMESRTWLLPFISNNKAVLHSVQSLSSYFFSVALNDIFPDAKQQCKASVWMQVVEQADLCFERIQKDLADINQRGPQSSVIEKARVMESIIQLLIFEMFIQISGDWKIHFTPAITLFEDLLNRNGQQVKDSNLMLSFLESMGPQTAEDAAMVRQGWNPDQAAFRFFTAILLFIDVLASTSLRQPPRLKEYYASILEQPGPADKTASIDMSSFVGCQNWVIRALGEIATLDFWKSDMERSGSLSVPDLVRRAEAISVNIDEGLQRLDSTLPLSSFRSFNITRLQPYYDINASKADAGHSVMPTRIWAHAASIYLSVVVSGWQSSNAHIRQNVTQVLALLQDIKCSAQIRTLTWPICIAGCLADEEQEQDFRRIVSGAGDLLRIAGQIMEAVWTKRGSLDHETWDIGACLNTLGTPALLI